MKIKNIFLVTVSTMLLSPTLLFFSNTNKDENGNTENLAPLAFNKKKPFEMFDNYYKYNFAFRKMLSRQFLDLKANISEGSSTLPDKVIAGKDGWYFLGNSYNNVYSASLGVETYPKETIRETTDKVVEMKRFCDSLGIKFYFFSPPNSHTIYREKLPVKANDAPREFDLVKAELKGKVDMIDVRNDLFAAKKDQILYYKTDSHWNNYGGLIGVQGLLNTMQKDFPQTRIVNKEDYNIRTVVTNQMDLTKSLGIFVDENAFKFDLKVKSTAVVQHDTINKVAIARMKNPKKPYRGIMYRDSYAVFMVPFLDEVFGDMTYYWSSKFLKHQILAEKPDFVIYEVVERNLIDIEIK